MSIFLSNYYLDDIDTLFDNGYARYGDDMFFDLTIHDKDILLQTLIKELNNLNLVLNKDKIRVINTGEFLKNV